MRTKTKHFKIRVSKIFSSTDGAGKEKNSQNHHTKKIIKTSTRNKKNYVPRSNNDEIVNDYCCVYKFTF